MKGRVAPVCARLMRDNPVLADRMWSGGERGDGGLDRAARARAVRLCRACPVRVDCLVDAMPVARMRDDTTIVGGLTTPARARLQRLVADGLHAPASLAGFRRAWCACGCSPIPTRRTRRAGRRRRGGAAPNAGGAPPGRGPHPLGVCPRPVSWCRASSTWDGEPAAAGTGFGLSVFR